MVWVQIDGVRAQAEQVLIEHRIAFHRVSPGSIQVPPEDFDTALGLLRSAAASEMEAGRIGQTAGLVVDSWYGWEAVPGTVPDPQAPIIESFTADLVNEAIGQMSAAPADGGGDAPVSPPPPPSENRILRFEWSRYAYRGNRNLWQQTLNAWALQRQVNLEVFCNRQSPLRSVSLFNEGSDMSYGVVIYGTCFDGEIHPDALPQAIDIAGRHYKLVDDQRSCVPPDSSRGGVLSDAAGRPVAQVVGRTVWILFRMHASASKITFSVLRNILDRAWPLLQDASAQAVYEEPVNLELVASQYATFRSHAARTEAATMRDELLVNARELREFGEKIVALERRRMMASATIQAMEQLASSNGTGAATEFGHLIKMPGVKKILVVDDALVVYTAPMEIRGTPIGSFSIRVTARGAVAIKNLTNPKTLDGRRIDHPHVTAGEPCWGNIQHGISQMLGRGQYPEAVQVIMSYLGTCNEQDIYGRRISLWRE